MMRPIRDPEGAELCHLAAACELKDKTILEIGVGDGKLVRQYADMPGSIFGIDPDATDLQIAQQDVQANARRVNLVRAMGEDLPFPAHGFDLVLFGCSL